MAIKLTISGHPFIITESDGYAEIYQDGESRSKRHHSINASLGRQTVIDHDDDAPQAHRRHSGDLTLELTVESVTE